MTWQGLLCACVQTEQVRKLTLSAFTAYDYLCGAVVFTAYDYLCGAVVFTEMIIYEVL